MAATAVARPRGPKGMASHRAVRRGDAVGGRLCGSLLVIGRYAEVTAAALYGRDINLFWDLRFVPDVVALLARPERLWVVALAPVAALLFLVLLYRLLAWALVRLGEAMARPRERRAARNAGRGDPGFVRGPARWAPTFPGRFSPRPSCRRTRGRQGSWSPRLSRSKSLGAEPADECQPLARRGADVFLIFVESYGASATSVRISPLASPRTGRSSKRRFTIRMRDVVSAYVESPTFGGSSWLAHISLLSGVEVRDHDTNALLMTSGATRS